PVLYEAPLMLEKSGFSDVVCRDLQIDAPPCDLGSWEAMVSRIKSCSRTCKIALVGKYTQLHDAYLSVAEALHHAGYENSCNVQILWTDSEHLTPENYETVLSDADGILVPGGFGDRGIEGMILAARYAREKNIPYLGICLGMQIAVIEYARNVLGYEDANSREFDEGSEHLVIDFMPGQNDEIEKGGTLRLGSYPCNILPGTMMEKYYQAQAINERHRHRYEFNNAYRDQMKSIISGLSPDNLLVEAIEIPDHPFYVGVQFHPEFKSRPDKPHPLFLGLIKNSLKD
ncbi:MAG: CTP synthase, partial [Clostridiales bacterium]|nr:CTP synthase [Clostridiales bacterium]